MNWKKILPLILVFVILFAIFYFTEEKEEESSSVTFWNIDFDTIEYIPPAQESSLNGDYANKGFIAIREQQTFRSDPRFIITNVDATTNETMTYEGGYNIKNLFTELASLNTTFITQESPELLQKFSITSTSPKLNLKNGNTILKTIVLGKPNHSKGYAYAQTDNYVIGINSNITDKLKLELSNLRDKQLLNISGQFFRKVSFEGDVSYVFENDAYKENNILKQNWYLISGKKKKLTANTGTRIDGILRGLYVEHFGDDPKTKGYAVLKELISASPSYEMEIENSDGSKLKLLFFSRTTIDGKEYIPIQKVHEKISFSPAYITKDRLDDLLNAFKFAKDEPEGKK
ncbi:MAG: DUF4340 domain-containing protein [Leptospiraceae bacterium]|nr:DUF4340 domain-containing protein [Leptospiraceae bacterium]